VTHDQVEAMTLGDRLVVMDNGYAAQIGSPLDVYERPANLFVAGFIGSPAMNFLEATVAEDGKSLALSGESRLAAPPSGLAPWRGKRVTVGIRPEHLDITTEGRDGIRLTVDHVELLGADTLIHGRFINSGTSLTVRLPDVHPLTKSSVLALSVSPEKLHLFDPESQRRIDPKTERTFGIAPNSKIK
jgi:sn-glycerol 3-phosphate transport system ATP-binding protein